MQHVWDVLMITAMNQRFPNENDCVPFWKGENVRRIFYTMTIGVWTMLQVEPKHT